MLCECDGGSGAGHLRHDDDELIARPAAEEFRAPQGFRQAGRRRCDDHVADDVTVRIVHIAEQVDANE